MTRAILTASLCLACFSADASAQVRLINLSKRDVFVAQYGYSGAQSRSGDLAVYTPGGWWYRGWAKISPGDTLEASPGNFFVEGPNGAITWANRQSSVGYVTQKGFNTFIEEGAGANQRVGNLLRNGYRKVNFQALGAGNYTIGNDYRLVSKTFNFDFSSRDIKFHNGSYPVPGKVAYYTVSAREWGAGGKNWGHRDRKVWVSLSTEGAQKRPFGPREKGYYTGSVTVYYVQK